MTSVLKLSVDFLVYITSITSIMSTVAVPPVDAAASASSAAASASSFSSKPNAPPLSLPGNLSDAEVEELVATRLHNFVKGTSAPFTCGGSVSLDSPPEITLLGGGGDDDTKDGEGKKTASSATDTAIVIQPPQELREGKLHRYDYAKDSYRAETKKKRADLFEQQGADLSDLLGSMPRAPFGKGGETVYDTSIRDALQLKAEKFELSIPQDKLDGILAEIKKGLDLETDVIAEPYSLNAYQKGGKFARHKDTPRGDDMLGTLVICLPSWFTGGKMTVSLGDETKEYFGNPSKYSWQEKEPPKPRIVEWCAFFADVDHEIHEVEEGVRITAAFLLKRGDRASASSNLPKRIAGQEQADRIKEGLLGGLRDERFLASGGKVGFPCLHLYTNTEVFPGKKDSSQALTPAQISKLKGRDLLIANAGAAAGLAVRLVPYLGHDYSQDGQGDYPLHKFPNKKKPPRRMDDDKIQAFFKTDEPGYPDSAADLWILDFDSAAQTKAGETEWNAEGYFGNEASWISFYVKACLIIDVPSHSASRGVPVQVPPPKKKRKTTPKLSVATTGAASASSSAAKVVTPSSAGTYTISRYRWRLNLPSYAARVSMLHLKTSRSFAEIKPLTWLLALPMSSMVRQVAPAARLCLARSVLQPLLGANCFRLSQPPSQRPRNLIQRPLRSDSSNVPPRKSKRPLTMTGRSRTVPSPMPFLTRWPLESSLRIFLPLATPRL